MKKILIITAIIISVLSTEALFNTYYGGGLYFNSQHDASAFGITSNTGLKSGFELCIEGIAETSDSKFDYGIGMDLTSYGDLDIDPLSSVQFGAIYLTGRYYFNGKYESAYFVFKFGMTCAYNGGGKYTISYDSFTNSYYKLTLSEDNYRATGIGWNIDGKGTIEVTFKTNTGTAYDPFYGANIDVENERVSLVYLMKM